MSVRYASKISKKKVKTLLENRMYVPGRLFGQFYRSPEDYPYEAAVVVSKEDDEVTGVCIYFDKFKYGWRGNADGLVGVYVKPEHRGKGIAGKMVKHMLKKNKKVMGHTPDLNRVASAIASGRWKKCSPREISFSLVSADL